MKSINTHDTPSHSRSGSLVHPNNLLVQALAAAAFTMASVHSELERQDSQLMKVTAEAEHPVASPHAEKPALTPEDERLLQEIDRDLDISLDHCSSCANLLAIPKVLLRLPIGGEPISIEKLRSASKGCVTEELYECVDRSLTTLENHPHLSLRASELAEQKLNALGAMDLRRPALLTLLSLCRKQMIEQQEQMNRKEIVKQ